MFGAKRVLGSKPGQLFLNVLKSTWRYLFRTVARHWKLFYSNRTVPDVVPCSVSDYRAPGSFQTFEQFTVLHNIKELFLSFDAAKVTNKLHMEKFFTKFFQKKAPRPFGPRAGSRLILSLNCQNAATISYAFSSIFMGLPQ